METRLAALLQELRSALEALYGDRLVHVILYGSQARGEATADSDIDVMVVLKGTVDLPGREIDRMMPVLEQLWNCYTELVTIVPISERDYQNRKSPLLLTVRAEGVPV